MRGTGWIRGEPHAPRDGGGRWRERLPSTSTLAVAGVIAFIATARWVAGGDSPTEWSTAPLASGLDAAPTPAEGGAPGDPAPTDGQGGDGSEAPEVVAIEPVAVSFGTVEIRSPGGVVAAVPDDVQAAVLATLQQYVTAASLDPVTPGGPASGVDLASLFTAETQPRLDGPDRRTLVDERLPAAVGGVSANRAVANVSALAAEDGTVQVVTVDLDLELVVHSADGDVLVARSGEVVLVPRPEGWKIDGYRLTVRRELGAGSAAGTGV